MTILTAIAVVTAATALIAGLTWLNFKTGGVVGWFLMIASL